MFSFVTGFVVFPIIGHLTHIQGIPFDALTVGGPGLAFVTYPAALSLMPGFSANIFCVIFFLTFFMLGIDSAFSMVEGIIANLQETRLLGSLSRPTHLIGTCALGCLGSMLYAADIGYYMLDLIDFYINNFCLLVIVLLEAYAVGWGHDRKTMIKLVGMKASVMFEIFVSGGILCITFMLFLLWEFTSGSVAYGIGFGLIGITMVVGILLSIHFVAIYVRNNGNEIGEMTHYETALFVLCLHQPNKVTKILNRATTNGEDSGKNWTVGRAWSLLVKFAVPASCTILLAFAARSIGRQNGYESYPIGFQLIGTFVMLFINSVIPLAMIFPELS
eukprot:Awhi_evm1s6334